MIVFYFVFLKVEVVDYDKFEVIVCTKEVFNSVIVEVAIDSDLYCLLSIFSFSGDAVIVFYCVFVEVFNFVMVECL